MKHPPLRRVWSVTVHARHLAMFVVVLCSGLMLLGSLVLDELQELRATCSAPVLVEADSPDTANPPAEEPWTPPVTCLQGEDGEWLRDTNGVLICGEVL